MSLKSDRIDKDTDHLTEQLFQNPTAQYRGAPFWAWNGDLKQNVLFEQIEYFKKMGFGGAHLHIRSGMQQRFLGNEHMQLVKDCVEKFKQEDMIPRLYDEDRWPSGAGGGYVTKKIQNRRKALRLTVTKQTEDAFRKLLAFYDIQLKNGVLLYYQRISRETDVQGKRWFAYLEIDRDADPWFNNQTYVDTLSRSAIEDFVGCVHESYYQAVGEEFGKVIPSVFTDEPQFRKMFLPAEPDSTADVVYPWTTDFVSYFQAFCGMDILDHLPEIVWSLPDEQASQARYLFHDCLTELFAASYADTVGQWCEEHNLMLTGHVNYEGFLRSQTLVVGEAMRTYRAFQLPGIDMLCHGFEYATAKQCQSVVHQYDRCGMLAEVYGVTNWDFDFRGHKNQGDWLAALGVTVRVPHLSWYTMEGEAKRDYPASISYQSPWSEKYDYIEAHYARINTAMTRGKPVVRVGVVHPIESYWLHYAAGEKAHSILEAREKAFADIIEWLLFSACDFDFVCEALLPRLCEAGTCPLQVGAMAYDVIVVPECETLRASTLDRLEAFRAAGGEIIFMGKAPALCDAKPSERGSRLYEGSTAIPFEKIALIKALKPYRSLSVHKADGQPTDNLIYQLRREENGTKWLFVANGRNCYWQNTPQRQDIQIILDGSYRPTLYNTLTGEITDIPFEITSGKTVISHTVYQNDSILLELEPRKEAVGIPAKKNAGLSLPIPIAQCNDFSLSEDNVLVLDMAEYRLDDGPWQKKEEILRIDNACRIALGWGELTGLDAQPWVSPQAETANYVTLRFAVESEAEVAYPKLAVEQLSMVQIWLNGQTVKTKSVGYYIDRCLEIVQLPPLHKGDNILEVRCPISRRILVENLFLLGQFGVRVSGCRTCITKLPEALYFGDVRGQGLGFYGANITYKLHIQIPRTGRLKLNLPEYAGALVGVKLDGVEQGNIVFAPYELMIPKAVAGEHILELCLYGNRFNTLGQLHYNHDIDVRLHDFDEMPWYGPKSFRTTGEMWDYNYRTKPVGIMEMPEFHLLA